MTNLKRANGMLKIVNRKIASDETAPGSPTRPLVGGSGGGSIEPNEPGGQIELKENLREPASGGPKRKQQQQHWSNHLSLAEEEEEDEGNEEEHLEAGEDEVGAGGQHQERGQLLAEQEVVVGADEVQVDKLKQRLSDRKQQQQRRRRRGRPQESKGVGGEDLERLRELDENSQVDQLQEQLALSESSSSTSACATKKAQKDEEFKTQLVWRNIVLFIILHSSLPIGAYLAYTQRPWPTLAWALFCSYISGLGVTGGAHRLWSHRSYKASTSVELLLMALQTMAGQNSIYTWCRDHRVHHKFSETSADPHNIKRGFFFAHMGWLCCKKHPDVKEKGKLIDMSDLEANRVVMFQHRHFWWLAIVFTVLVPTLIPVLLWNESFWTSLIFSFMVRYLFTLHGTWLVNSAAHYYGSRPYDSRIEARESPMVILTGLGEGFHNYHHTFPYDYSTSEFGKFFNITTAFIDLCASLGLVYDRRKMDKKTIAMRQLRTGSGTNNNNDKQDIDQSQKVGGATSSGALEQLASTSAAAALASQA